MSLIRKGRENIEVKSLTRKSFISIFVRNYAQSRIKTQQTCEPSDIVLRCEQLQRMSTRQAPAYFVAIPEAPSS